MHVSGDWSNVYVKVRYKSYQTKFLDVRGLPCVVYVDGNQITTLSGTTGSPVPPYTWGTIASGADWSSYASDGIIELHFTGDASSSYTPTIDIAELQYGVGTASFIDYFKRTDIQVALMAIAVIAMVIFVRKRRVKRYARRH